MTIPTTYDELQDLIGQFLARDEYKAAGSDSSDTEVWIDLVEKDLNNNPGFLLSAFERTDASTSTTASTASLALPADFKAVRSATITSTDPNRNLEFISADEYRSRFLFDSDTDVPLFFTIIGDNAFFGKIPGGAYTVTWDYWSKITTAGPGTKPTAQQPLSDSNTTNWLLENAYEVYLWGALTIAREFLGNEFSERLTNVPALYQRAVNALTGQSASRRISHGPVRAIPSGSTP